MQLAPFLPIPAAALVLFGPTLLAGRTLFWGTPILQFIPWWSYALEAVLSSRLPLWNNLAGMGAPLLANYQTGLFYLRIGYIFSFTVGGAPHGWHGVKRS